MNEVESQVEKMYENAGVEPINFAKQGAIDFTNTIEIDGKRYPDFTADKQLEIVKFMLHKGIYYDTDGDTYWFHYTDEIENATYRPFEEAIAEFINGFWQLLIEKERKQIRNILV